MIDENIGDIPLEELENAQGVLRKEWGIEVEEKIDQLLEYRLVESSGGLESNEPQRVIIYYKPKRPFEDTHAEFLEYSCQRKGNVGIEALAKEEFALIEESAEQSAALILESLENNGIKVEEHLRLANAVVAHAKPADIKNLAERPDIERIESDKYIIQEVDISANTVGLVEARNQRVVQRGRNVIVAVLDGEVDRNHPDLKGRVIHKRNYTAEDWGNPSKHGTHVAGIIAGNGIKYQGIAPEAIIWNYKLYPSGQAESAEGFKGADAIEDAVKDGAKIINCSWGASQTALDGSSIWAVTAERATKLGTIVVKSAGNKGPGEQTITSPADAKGDVIVVGASSHNGDAVMDFSSRGPTQDNRPKPDITAPGDGIMAAKEGGEYRQLSGTSMAAPHIAGIAALMLEIKPGSTPAQVKQALMQSARKLAEGDYDQNAQGMGLVEVRKAMESLSAGKAESENIMCTISSQPNKREDINVLIRNTSKTKMEDIQATLRSLDPLAKVVTNQVNYGSISAGMEREKAWELEISAGSRSDDYNFHLELEYTNEGTNRRSISMPLRYMRRKT